MIKRTFVITIAVVFMLLILTACSQGGGLPEETSLPWNPFDVDENIINDLREKRGYFIFDQSDAGSDDLYLGAFMGIKPSSGYDVLMGSVLLNEDDMLIITLKEVSPAPGQEVNDEETYPYLLFMIPDSVQRDFQIISEDGEEFQLLTLQ